MPHSSRCRLTGVGEALLDEAREADKMAATFMQKYTEFMAKVTGHETVVEKDYTDHHFISRWGAVQEEGKKLAINEHDQWHQLFQGTANSKLAHE